MTPGVDRATLNYIRRRELEISTMKYMIRVRALRDIREVLRMEEDKRVEIAKNLRIGRNKGDFKRNPLSKWGKNLRKISKDLGLEEIITIIRKIGGYNI